ncbi:ABC transporter ATP-binding protein [Sulfitobacter sp. EhC04]|uniref:ABC transporter ATP-binding protein n=1 Tax=Sulfitobacter sp. EhC04 TaxID=1849168 RepID=UPI0007F47C70|nr:ABC transporter ATP-binding protein [Sulfitobacter sp. EhC04]OAN75686.1 ABC transporter ATP-binding protein [Sulfitobacter sp. EhC04]
MTVLAVTNLSRRFGAITVADNLSFEVAQGECLGIIGPNGAGKTSVFNMLTGNVKPEAGRIVLDGKDMTGATAHARTKAGLGRTYQVPQPFGRLTAFENVLAAAVFGGGAGHAAQHRARDVISRTGLKARADKPAESLPLLDRKRLELARAMALRPRLLLLDEIAGGLTEAEVHELVELIQELKPDVAMVWIEHVTHALSAVAERILAINFGAEIASGLPDAVMRDPAVLEIYMGAVLDAPA